MTIQDALCNQITLIKSLHTVLEKNGSQVQCHETHISWVLVTKEFAYKFKKAVHFDFVDFSTLDARHFYCQEELRLNRRLAPDLYLDVVAVTGDPEHPTFADEAAVAIEYAVRMRAFPQEALWSHRIGAGVISAKEIDALALSIARFHADTAVAGANSAWSAPDMLQATADETLAAIASLTTGTDQQALVSGIRAWQQTQQQQLRSVFEDRKAKGMVRECHGDLHGRNILTVNDEVQVFDCIEFNENLRWIDVMNDIAFTCMDLQVQGRQDLAARFLNRYLELTGDYEGLAVLRYYLVQRALVRCKVALMRVRQLRADALDSASEENQAARYLDYSATHISAPATAVMITHGYSGSGKSTFAEHLAELAGAVRIRSDVERKRMHGLAALSRAAVSQDTDIYDAAATKMTYHHLCMLARHVIESGMPVIIDAAFLRKEQRYLFEDLARAVHVPFFIFDIYASVAVMQERIGVRERLNLDASDAGLAILAQQLANHDPLSDDELKHTIKVDSERDMNPRSIKTLCEPVLRLFGTKSSPQCGST